MPPFLNLVPFYKQIAKDEKKKTPNECPWPDFGKCFYCSSFEVNQQILWI